jgi:hypothetical protein
MTPNRRSTSFLGNWTKVLIVAAIGLGALLVWQYFERKREQEAVFGAMVTAFQKQNSLNVFRAQVPVFVQSREDGWLGLDREQFGVVPASVDYKLDMSKMTADDFDWDPERRVMIIELPPVVPAEPSLDARRAKFVNKGVLMGSDSALRLMQQNMERAHVQAAKEARNPQLMELARAAAREMVARNYALPLRAAGFDGATVEARFPTDGTGDGSRITGSTPYEEAIKEAERRRAAEGQK